MGASQMGAWAKGPFRPQRRRCQRRGRKPLFPWVPKAEAHRRNSKAGPALLTSSCPECLSQRSLPAKAELHPWEWPSHPWHRMHVDYAGQLNGRYFLVIVDAHSKWVDVYPTSGTTAQETIKCLQHSFSQFGLPISIVSDNGPCFTSQEFKDFTRNSGVRHITTAVYKPSTNGLAEKMVHTLKKALRI